MHRVLVSVAVALVGQMLGMPTSNLAAQTRMGTIASSPKLIVPGHDPQVFARFPAGARRVARID